MTSRRTVLSRVIALAVGGSLVGVDTVGADDPAVASQDTVLVAKGSANVLRTTGVPNAVAPAVASTLGRYQSISLPTLGEIEGFATSDGSRIHSGAVTVHGTFDRNSVTREVAATTDFVPVERANATIRGHVSTGTDTAHTEPRDSLGERDGTGTDVLINTDRPALLAIDPDRIDVSRGGTLEDAGDRLAQTRRTSATDVAESETGLASLLTGDVVAHVSLGPSTRQRIRAELPESATDLDAVVRHTRSAGIAADVNPETSHIRYAVVLDGTGAAEDSVESLVTALEADDSVSVHRMQSSGPTIVVDVSITTASLWTVHRQLPHDE